MDEEKSSAVLNWLALQMRANHEEVVQQPLEQEQLQSFLPNDCNRRTWLDRIKPIDQPLFSRYVFCQLNPEERVPVVKTPAGISIVESGKAPIPISDAEITSLKTVIDSPSHAEPWLFLQVGQKVRIEKGPLAGVEGILQNCKPGCRIVVSISLPQKSFTAEMDRNWVSAVSKVQ